MKGVLKGKRGLVMGVANERSIAWGVAREMHGAGAEVAITYQGEAFEGRARALAETIGAQEAVFDVDVGSDESLDAAFGALSDKWGSLDFLVHSIAFSDKSEMSGRFIDTSRANFSHSLDISAYSLVEAARRARPMMLEKGGSVMTLTFIGSNRVFPFYNVMGVAKAALESAVRYLAADLGPEGIRVNAISPGPMRTLAGAAIGGSRRTFRHSDSNAPLGSNASLESVGGTAVYLASGAGEFTTGETIRVDGGYHILGMPRVEES